MYMTHALLHRCLRSHTRTEAGHIAYSLLCTIILIFIGVNRYLYVGDERTLDPSIGITWKTPNTVAFTK